MESLGESRRQCRSYPFQSNSVKNLSKPGSYLTNSSSIGPFRVAPGLHLPIPMLEPVDVQDRAFDQIQVGDSVTLERRFSEEDAQAFRNTSGDLNPLHRESDYAAASAFDSPIVPGLLIATPISRIAGHHLPGLRCLLQGVKLDFVRAVRFGELLAYRATVAQLSPATQTIRVKIEVRDARDRTVLRGSFNAQVLREER